MNITRRDVTHPTTYHANTKRVLLMRRDDFKQTLLQLDFGNGDCMSVWLSDDEIAALATMARDAHESSKPLFPTTEPLKEAA